MTNLLDELIGKTVSIWSVYGDSSAKDIGVLDAFDGIVVRLKRSDGKLLYFPIYHIRLIEPRD